MGALNKAMVYLGLSDNDDQYRVDDMYPETGSIDQIQPTGGVNSHNEPQAQTQAHPQTPQPAAPPVQSASQAAPGQAYTPDLISAANQPVERQAEVSAPAPNKVTPINKAAEGKINRITTIHPRSFSDAKLIGESFRNNVPVIMNVTDMGSAEAKRLVDFSAGLIFAMHGSLERVTSKVFLLSPSYVEVVSDEHPGQSF